MFSKRYIAIFIMAVFMLSFVPASSAAPCPKDSPANCSKSVCITYVKCNGNEYIKITNNKASAQSVYKWKVSIQSSKKQYVIPYKPLLKSKQSIYIYTGKGYTRGNVMYMGLKGDIIKCKGETVSLNASCGKLVSVKRI